VPACGSLRRGPHIESAPRALRDAVREDHVALRSGTTSIERCISSAFVLRRLPHATGSGPDVVSLCGLRWFCRQRAVHCAVSPMRYRVALANAIASARPPCTPACLIDAGASLSQSQPFDFCNEFSKYDTRARIPASAVLARCRGWPCDRCHARCALNAARFFLFGVQRRLELDAPQRATRDSPTLTLER
jgi:hypothetical protein